MSSKRYPEEFKIEAVKQVTEKGHSVAEVAARLGTTTHSLYAWIKRYDPQQPKTIESSDPSTELAKLKKELQNHVKRVTAPYKYPRIVEFVKELPKTTSGKIRRAAIRAEEGKK